MQLGTPSHRAGCLKSHSRPRWALRKHVGTSVCLNGVVENVAMLLGVCAGPWLPGAPPPRGEPLCTPQQPRHPLLLHQLCHAGFRTWRRAPASCVRTCTADGARSRGWKGPGVNRFPLLSAPLCNDLPGNCRRLFLETAIGIRGRAGQREERMPSVLTPWRTARASRRACQWCTRGDL